MSAIQFFCNGLNVVNRVFFNEVLQTAEPFAPSISNLLIDSELVARSSSVTITITRKVPLLFINELSPDNLAFTFVVCHESGVYLFALNLDSYRAPNFQLGLN